jgi:hypothetical protein
MADEIIVGERRNGSQAFVFYYAIPEGVRIPYGGSGTDWVVHSPTAGMNEDLLKSLTVAEKTALDLGESLVVHNNLNLKVGSTQASLIADARASYAKTATTALTEYQARYANIGVRLDKE